MKVTFLVGNGFDIAAGIDTSYRGFYNWYCNQPDDSDIVQKLKQEIKEDISNGRETWADFEIGLGQFTKKFEYDAGVEFLNCYEDAHDKLVEYIENEKNRGELSVIESEMNQFGDGLLKFYQELPPKERQSIVSLLEKDKANDTLMQFISFNYTDVLDQCVRMLAKKVLNSWTFSNITHAFRVASSVIHVHGTLDEYPILGVNDVSQIANPMLLSIPQFSEIMIKPESVNSIGQLWHENASKRISDSSIVCIYGMSLGDSDAIWWKNLMSWLTSDPDRHLIIYWYTDSLQDRISILKRNREIAKVKSRIMSFLNTPKDISELIQDRIHVILNTKKVLRISLKRTNITAPIEENLVKA